MKSPVVKRSIVLAGHKTSVSLEDAFWAGLKEIAGKRLMTVSDLVIDSQRQKDNLSSALRLFVWPAPGSEDTELGVLMELEVGHGETEVYAGVQA